MNNPSQAEEESEKAQDGPESTATQRSGRRPTGSAGRNGQSNMPMRCWK